MPLRNRYRFNRVNRELRFLRRGRKLALVADCVRQFNAAFLAEPVIEFLEAGYNRLDAVANAMAMPLAPLGS